MYKQTERSINLSLPAGLILLATILITEGKCKGLTENDKKELKKVELE